MQYHRFRPEPLPPSSEPSSDRTSAARSIDPKPILSLLLEPRSLVITTSDLYTSHLHAIEPLVQDVIPTPSTTSAADMGKSGHGAFANESLIIGEKYKKVIEEGGTLERDTRISLTCRVVEKVLAIGGKRAGEKGLLRR